MTFIELCKENKVDIKNWKEWLEQNSINNPNIPPYELLGINNIEYEDLLNGVHSMEFFLLKRELQKPVKNLWAGCYVKFAFEIDAFEPHFEFGWVDVVNNEKGFCKVQCDDNFFGARAITLRIMDVLEILPFKERPLLYYKTMICNDCNDCDRSSNELPPENCKYFEFFNAILNKQLADLQFLRLYQNVNKNSCQTNCHSEEEQHCCSCKDCNGSCH